jgi:hypothetical protein
MANLFRVFAISSLEQLAFPYSLQHMTVNHPKSGDLNLTAAAGSARRRELWQSANVNRCISVLTTAIIHFGWIT